MRRWLLVVVPVAVLLSACSGDGGVDPVSAETVPPTGQPRDGVTVHGVGEASGPPDVARTTVGVEVTRDTVDAAVSDANAAVDAVLEAVRAQGVDPADIQTTQLSIRPEHRFFDDRPPELRGYTVTNMVTVEVREIERAGELLAAVAAAGGDATRVEQLTFEVDDEDALLAEARAQAFADARRKAAQYAELSDASLGRILSITEGPTTEPPRRFAADAAAQEASAIPIATGSHEVTVEVQVAWSLE